MKLKQYEEGKVPSELPVYISIREAHGDRVEIGAMLKGGFIPFGHISENGKFYLYHIDREAEKQLAVLGFQMLGGRIKQG